MPPKIAASRPRKWFDLSYPFASLRNCHRAVLERAMQPWQTAGMPVSLLITSESDSNRIVVKTSGIMMLLNGWEEGEDKRKQGLKSHAKLLRCSFEAFEDSILEVAILKWCFLAKQSSSMTLLSSSSISNQRQSNFAWKATVLFLVVKQ